MIQRVDDFIAKNGANEGVGQIKRTLDSILNTDPATNWWTLQTLQDTKNALFRKGDVAQFGLTASDASRLSAAADSTMEMLLRREGGNSLVSKWKVAKSRYKTYLDASNDKLVQGIIKADTDNAYKLLKGASAANTDTIKKMLRPEDWQLVKARFWQDALEESSDVPISEFRRIMYRATGRQAAASPREAIADPKKVLSRLKSLGPEKLAKMYTDEELAGMNTFLDAAEKVGARDWKNVSGLMLNGYMYYGLIRGLQGDVGQLAGTAGVAVATKVLGKLMTNPPMAKRAANFLNALGKAGESPYTNPAVAYWGQRMARDIDTLNAELKKEEEEREQ
jgi:hypothetical protein